MKAASIVVAEDREAMASRLAAQVRAMGHTVAVIVQTTDQILEQVRKLKSKPDLCLVTTGLKGSCSALELVGKLREEFALPVVLLATPGDGITLQQIQDCDPAGYLPNPADDRFLWVTLRRAVESPRVAYGLAPTPQPLAAEQRAKRSRGPLLAPPPPRAEHGGLQPMACACRGSCS